MTAFRLHSRSARLLLAALLLLATQFAIAGQLCHGVMLGALANAAPMQSMAQMAAERTGVAQPCCEPNLTSAADCPIALMGSGKGEDWTLANAQLAGIASAPPTAVLSVLSVRRAIAVPLPAASAGPAPPVYILFARFLS